MNLCKSWWRLSLRVPFMEIVLIQPGFFRGLFGGRHGALAGKRRDFAFGVQLGSGFTFTFLFLPQAFLCPCDATRPSPSPPFRLIQWYDDIPSALPLPSPLPQHIRKRNVRIVTSPNDCKPCFRWYSIFCVSLLVNQLTSF